MPPLLYGVEVRPAYEPSALPIEIIMSYKGLANQHGCALHADAAQAGELLDHLAGPVRSIGRRNLISFTLELFNLRKYELQPQEQTLNFGQCIRRDWLAEARSQFSQPATSTLKKRIIVVDAKRRQNSADLVREADTLGEQLGPLADTPPSILIGFVWDRALSNTRGSPRSQRQAKCAGAARHRCHPISLGAGADPPVRSKAGRHGPRRLAPRATLPARTLTIQPRR